uniref:Uncharacterized protein n=1 Tax=Dulem virus 96 TaxID=3145807 RepID=A0AAU8B3K3_9VIRU
MTSVDMLENALKAFDVLHAREGEEYNIMITTGTGDVRNFVFADKQQAAFFYAGAMCANNAVYVFAATSSELYSGD